MFAMRDAFTSKYALYVANISPHHPLAVVPPLKIPADCFNLKLIPTTANSTVVCTGKAYIYRDPEFASIFPDGEAAEMDDGDLCDQGETGKHNKKEIPIFFPSEPV